MELIEVKSKKAARDFIRVPLNLYKKDRNWIRPLDADIDFVFDTSKNRYFKHGEASRWILRDDRGKLVGRVAAFINEKTAYSEKQPTGGMGFFECVDNQEWADLLFNQCKKWLQERGMEAMDGPINFGERNSWWGLLIEGFEEPCYQMNYNPPYYRKLFESYGFKEYFRQFSYGLEVEKERPQKYYERAKNIARDPNYHFRYIEKDKMDEYAEYFRVIYNRAWKQNMSKEQSRRIMQKLRPVVVDYLVWFGFYKDDPIAVYVNLPELNQYFKYVNGKMNWLGKLKFVYHRMIGSNRKFFGTVFGVVPEHQGKGVEGALIMAANDVIVPSKRWDVTELIWIGDFNPKMMRVAENLGCHISKVHVTYRKLFDPNAPFERHPIKE